MCTFSTMPIAAVVEVGQKNDQRSIVTWKRIIDIDDDDDAVNDRLPLPNHD